MYLWKIHEVGGQRLVESVRRSHNPSIISFHCLVLREGWWLLHLLVHHWPSHQGLRPAWHRLCEEQRQIFIHFKTQLFTFNAMKSNCHCICKYVYFVTFRTIRKCWLHHRLTGGTAHSKWPDATLSNWWGIAGGQHGVVDCASLPDAGKALCSNWRGHFTILLVGATRFCLDLSGSHCRGAKRWGCPRRHGGHWRLT